MLIRKAEPRDIEELRYIYLAVRKATFPWLDTAGYELADYDRDTDGEHVWVSCSTTSEICGFISVWKPEPFIHHLYVSPSAQRRGVGTALLRKGLSELARPVHLKCLLRNERALQFYNRFGWIRMAEAEGSDGPFVLMQYQEKSNKTIEADI